MYHIMFMEADPRAPFPWPPFSLPLCPHVFPNGAPTNCTGRRQRSPVPKMDPHIYLFLINDRKLQDLRKFLELFMIIDKQRELPRMFPSKVTNCHLI